MLIDIGMEVFGHSRQWRIHYIQYPIFLTIVQYEPDTNTDIVTALVLNRAPSDYTHSNNTFSNNL